MKYKFLDHTADAKFRAFGATLEEAYANAALAMFSVMVDPDEVEPAAEKAIEVSGEDKKSLLYNWLEELLFLMDSESFLLSKVRKIKIEGKKLTAVVAGDTEVEKYKTHGDVKAVTYSEMEITEKGKQHIVQVVVDI